MARGPHTAHRLDTNHKSIVAVFKARGLLVLSLTSLGGGAPDLIVGHPFNGRCRFVEVKSGKGALRTSQSKFSAEGWWVKVIRDEASAEALATELIGS